MTELELIDYLLNETDIDYKDAKSVVTALIVGNVVELDPPSDVEPDLSDYYYDMSREY